MGGNYVNIADIIWTPARNDELNYFQLYAMVLHTTTQLIWCNHLVLNSTQNILTVTDFEKVLASNKQFQVWKHQCLAHTQSET